MRIVKIVGDAAWFRFRAAPVRFPPGSAHVLFELVAAAGEVGGLAGVAGKFDGPVVGGAGLLIPAESAEQVGPGGVVEVIAGQ